ncbi:hypothetical protein [Hahella ganghwensis]|uniref:hypothetical protein n=1 Tax=Hahella ganghwensis TaxID=286420 RepID=UPI00036250FE|nr:hypothetical protein [Hahella ganghwensis]
MDSSPHNSRYELSINEIYTALVTGTRPVFFQETEGDFIWGIGTLFLAQWGGKQFAITAKHVIDNQGVNPQHLRIFIPGYKVALPLVGASTSNHPNHECREEVEDIFVWQIDKEPDFGGEELSWHTWRMKEFWMPANILKTGQQIFAVGYPDVDNRYDYEAMKLETPPLIAIGKLSSDQLGNDVYTIDCDDFTCDLNGISGGPVFARFDGYFFYVGMIVRAGRIAQKIHFVDAIYVTLLLDQIEKNS